MSLQVREAEVERVLRAFKKNPYDVLDLPAFASEAEVKKQYRKKSLLIHPDKFQHEKGHEAFDLLKKAESLLLSEPNKREEIDSIMTYSRTLVLKDALGDAYVPNIPNDDPRLANLNPPFQTRLRAKARQMFLEDEFSKMKRQNMVNINEAEERARKDAEVANRKRKQEDAQRWEETREARVDNYRNYLKTTKEKKAKKAKKNLHVLG